MDVKAVFFDAGNTIIYPDPLPAVVYSDALRRRGIDADPERMEESFTRAFARIRQQCPDGTTRGVEEAMAWWRDVVRWAVEPFGMPDDFEDVFMELWDYFALPEAWGIFDDAVPTMAALREREVGLGLLSNWDNRLPRILENLDLTKWFDWSVVSYAVRVEKPAPAIFRRALDLCGLPAERVLHVGDSYEDDAMGACKAGLQAAWLCREGVDIEPPDGASAIGSLTEILDLLS